MKNFISIILLTACFIIFPGISGWYETHYTMEAEVTARYGTTTIVTDVTGNIWKYGKTSFSVGDKVKVTFDTNFTDTTREDDKIEKITIIS